MSASIGTLQSLNPLKAGQHSDQVLSILTIVMMSGLNPLKAGQHSDPVAREE